MGNKQEELKATVQLEIYDLIIITGMWWDKSGYWSGDIGGYKLFRRDKQERRRWSQKGCRLCKENKLIDYTELSLKTRDEHIRTYR